MAKNVDHAWKQLSVELAVQLDIGKHDDAVEAALAFLMLHPAHSAARQWLLERQGGELKTGLPAGSAQPVLAVDRALDRDQLILDSLRKLVAPNLR